MTMRMGRGLCEGCDTHTERAVRGEVRRRRAALRRVVLGLEAVPAATHDAPGAVRRLDEALDRVYEMALAELAATQHLGLE